jgi:hypothetical protein
MHVNVNEFLGSSHVFIHKKDLIYPNVCTNMIIFYRKIDDF